MRCQEHNSRVHRNIGTKITRQNLIPLFVACVLICKMSMAGEMVPFVIPAKPNPDSLIAFTSFEHIRTDSNRLKTQSGHFYRDGERVRLWGVNLSFGANMPRHEDAPYIAARLAAAGVNTVRCHHMDTARWPRGLWNTEDGKTISPEALDRLDFFIDQLARHGICVNINLHVGRAHSEYLGLPKTNRQYDKISNIFTPALIDAQKQFARQMLTHINPYRKVRYADDPAVAFVEITNENSFFMWASENTLRTLPPYYADILQKKYNAWLKKRYGSDEKLRRIWAEGAELLGKNLLNNSSLKMNKSSKRIPTGWNLEQHSGCKASLSQQRYESKNALCIKIDTTDDTEWHLQFNQGGISLKAGRYYTVMFEATADEPRKISCSVSQAHSSWSNLGLSRNVELSRKWQTFRFGFVSKADDENARLSFAFGRSKVPIHLANIMFHPGGRVSLQKGESIITESVAVFADNESPNRTGDRMQFLAEAEKAYFDGMRNFIKKDLGCKALVTGTIVFGPLGLYAQSDMDFIDTHAYWQHPRFPGRPWDRGNWLVEQKPMTDYPDEATLFRLAAARLHGKPFTLSEYNHPAPLDSQAECVPMSASF
ncbi:MAG: carbohydrate binding domain-containing protein, partial [Planctomycetota bacterium]